MVGKGKQHTHNTPPPKLHHKLKSFTEYVLFQQPKISKQTNNAHKLKFNYHLVITKIKLIYMEKEHLQ